MAQTTRLDVSFGPVFVVVENGGGRCRGTRSKKKLVKYI